MHFNLLSICGFYCNTFSFLITNNINSTYRFRLNHGVLLIQAKHHTKLLNRHVVLVPQWMNTSYITIT